MLPATARIRCAYNCGGLWFTILSVKNGHARRYARLGEFVGVVSLTRKKYAQDTTKELQLKFAKKIKKKKRFSSGKSKSKKKGKKQQKLKESKSRPYIGLIISLIIKTKRINGEYIRFDKNFIITFSEPTKYGPDGKYENIPNFVGTALKEKTLAIYEIRQNEEMEVRFKSVIERTRMTV